MPYTGNSTDDSRLWCRSKLCSCCCKVCCKTGILHTNFNRNGSFLCCIHTCKAACTVSKEVSKTVMKKNSNEDYGAELAKSGDMKNVDWAQYK